MSGSELYSIDDLLHLMARLREPGTGCPWDLAQTYHSIAPSTIEEAYEVVDAIEKSDFRHLREELGDLLLQVIFYSQFGTEDGHFTFSEIVSELVEKLLRRHPHVFPEGTLESRVTKAEQRDESAVKASWEKIKREEREDKGKLGILDDVPLALPSLSRALKLQKRAANVGFDWPVLDAVVAKLEEEVAELKRAIAGDDSEAAAEELGDLLFAAVNLSRHLKLDPEAVLRAGNSKFERRFRFVESRVRELGMAIDALSLEELDRYWEQAKVEEKNNKSEA